VKSATALVCLLLVGAGCALAAEEQDPLVVNGENAFGQVWVNLSLTGVRLNEPYVPMVIAVYNRAKRQATLTRDSFRLIGADGRDVRVPGVKELRQAYDKLTMDRRMMSTAGIPVGTWLRRDRMAPSNFFPGMGSAGGGTTIDHVAMPPLYGMIDLIYFERPKGLALGQPVILEVKPEGWEEPIRLRIRVKP
jgi:hypothetical protein